MVKVGTLIVLVICTTVNLLMINLAVKEPIYIWTVRDIKASGKMIANLVKGRRHGQMAANTWDSTFTAKDMAMVYSNGKTDLCTMGCGLMTTSMEMVLINGMMAGFTMDNGRTTAWMDMVSTLGLMESITKASLRPTKSMAKAS